MALNKNVTAEEHKKLPADIQKEYKADGDAFILDLEGGFEDTAALKRAKDHEKQAASEAKRLLKDAQDALEALTLEHTEMLKGNIPKADADKLAKSYDAKILKIETDAKAQVDALTGNLNTMLVDNVATSMAAKLSATPSVLMPHIKSRLRAEYKDGKAVTKVVDAAGEISALTVEDLEKEIVANKDFAPILLASRGSGGGAGGSGSGGGAGSGGSGKKIDFKQSGKNIAAQMKASGSLVPMDTQE